MRLLVLCLFLLGCSAAPSDDLRVQYGKEARKLGLIPVFPPREEFQLGDVFLWSQPTGKPDKRHNLWVGSMPEFQIAADKFLEDRIVFQSTAASGDQKDLFGTDLATRNAQRIQTLPIAAFPTVSGDAGFSGSIGILKALQAIGLAGGARTQVTLNFNDVRTYWVPRVNAVAEVLQAEAKKGKSISSSTDITDVLLSRLITTAPGRNVNTILAVPANILEQDSKRGGFSNSPLDLCDPNDTNVVGISVVSRVYLTRQINYTYRNGRIINAGVKRATSGTLSDIPTQSPVTVNVTPVQQAKYRIPLWRRKSLRYNLKLMHFHNPKEPGIAFRFKAGMPAA